jgi:hypothetical protein
MDMTNAPTYSAQSPERTDAVLEIDHERKALPKLTRLFAEFGDDA